MTVNWQLGVWPWSVKGGWPSVELTQRPPMLITLLGSVPPGMPQRAMSIWWTPWLPISPLPKSQNQCQL